MACRIVVVDDHPVIRVAVRSLLTRDGHEVVSETDNGVEAVSFIQKLQPDLVLLDICMPTLDGVAVIERIQKSNPSTKVIVFTSLSAEHYAMRCIKAGASAFISKADSFDMLPNIVQQVMGGYVYFPESTNVSRGKSDFLADEMEMIASLSNRELSIFRQLSLGMSNKAIAEDIMLSAKTVSCYKARLMDKLNVKSLVDLADLARRNKFI